MTSDRTSGDGYQWVEFGPEAGGFVEVVSMLARHAIAVDLVMCDGSMLGVVLGSVSDDAEYVVVEGWPRGADVPNGAPRVIMLADVKGIRVY